MMHTSSSGLPGHVAGETGATCSSGSRSSTVARKVVGVGSVGTRAFIVLLQGRDEQDPLFLQVKEATASVLGGSPPPRADFKGATAAVVSGSAADAGGERHLPRVDEEE